MRIKAKDLKVGDRAITPKGTLIEITRISRKAGVVEISYDLIEHPGLGNIECYPNTRLTVIPSKNN